MKKILVIFALAMLALPAKSQGFSSVCESGQELYYRITNVDKHYVEITLPHKYNLYSQDNFGTWQNHVKPVGDVVIPSQVAYKGVVYTVTGMDASTFHSCSEMTSVVIPNTVTYIGHSAFYGCEQLASVSIPSSVTTIGYYAFYGCKALKSVTIPFGVTTIKYWAFANTGLKEIEIPNSVTFLGYWAFADTDIKEIYIPASLTKITHIGGPFDKITVSPDNPVYDSRNDCNAIITREGDTLILGSDKTVMPDDVKAIGSYAFYNCKNLKTITIPSSVSYIGEVAFKQSGLETVTIPATVKCIAGGAFSECKDLKSMLIESPATNMTCGSYDVLGAITDCPNLTISLATTSLKIESGKYTIETWSWEDGSSSGDAVYRFIVPCGTAESFKNSDWGKMFEFRDDCDQKPEPEE